MARTELLTYTMERQDVTRPPLQVVESLAKNAPSMDIGERLAADRLRLTGRRSSREKPQARNSSSDQRSDCAPVSATADIRAPSAEPRLPVPSLSPTGMSIEMVINARGWSLSLARLHSPLEKMWCSSLIGACLLTHPCAGDGSCDVGQGGPQLAPMRPGRPAPTPWRPVDCRTTAVDASVVGGPYSSRCTPGEA